MAQEKTFTYLTVWYLFPECINSYSLYRVAFLSVVISDPAL